MGEGFYYKDTDNTLIYAANEVCDAGFHLLKDNHTDYEYPVFGWYWFNNEEEARVFFDI